MSIILQPFFWDERAAHAKLEQIVWPNGPVCPHCGANERIGAVTGKGARAGLKFCCACRKQFRATIGTMFEGSHVPLHKWFQACFLLAGTVRGISAHQLHLRLEVTNKTALCMVQRLETVMGAARRGPDGANGSAGHGQGGGRRRVRWRRSARRRALGAGPGTGPGTIDQEDLPWVKPPAGPPQQFLAFVETARELGYSEDVGKFDQLLTEISRHPPLFARTEAASRGRSMPAARLPVADPSREAGQDASPRRFG